MDFGWELGNDDDDQPAHGSPSFMEMMAGDVDGDHGFLGGSTGMLQNNQPQEGEQRSSNKSKKRRARNDDDAAALLVDEADEISPSNNNTDGIVDNPPAKKKRLNRLTTQQVQLLEGYFSICAHPDEVQRRQLSQTTGLNAQQVKFWFQNKRTHNKHVTGKEENYRLKVENEMLKDENRRLRQTHNSSICLYCSGPEARNLAAEMQKLKEQNELMQKELSRFQGEAPPDSCMAFQLDSTAENVIDRMDDTQMVSELLKNAMLEFVALAESHGPLWFPVPGGSFEILNKVAYAQKFPLKNGANAIGFKTEATRADAVVMLDPKNIVDYLMDAECYESLCPGLLSRAEIIKVYKPPTAEGYDGAMQLMAIETVFPSPLVPARKCAFVRYCRELKDGVVVVIDVSLDDGHGAGFFNCRKLPSGVLIRSLRPKSCKVTVVEHVQVADEDGAGVHPLYQPCLDGLFFGARRWASSMARQCARMRDVFHVTTGSLRGGNFSSNGRKTLMKLADDLLASFAGGIVAAPEAAWTVLRGAGTEDDIKVAYRSHGDDANTAVVSASASFRFPLPLKRTYDMLRNNMLRQKWDVLVGNGAVKEEVRVSNGAVGGDDDGVSIVHVKYGAGKKEKLMILQNSCYDASGSFMVYSPVDAKQMTTVLSPSGGGGGQEGGKPAASLYPTGFSLVPDGDAAHAGAALGMGGGTLVTVGFQILLKLARGNGLFPRSVSSAVNLMADNISNIKAALALSNSHCATISDKKNKSPI